MLSRGLIYSDDRNFHGRGFYKSSENYPPAIRGSLFIGAPVGAAIYLASRLIAGKEIKPLHLFLSAVGGGFLGGLINHLINRDSREGVDPELQNAAMKAIRNQITFNGEPIDSVIPNFRVGGKLIHYNTFSDYGVKFTDRDFKIGGLPAYNIYAEMGVVNEVPTVSAIYRTWYAHMAQTDFYAMTVLTHFALKAAAADMNPRQFSYLVSKAAEQATQTRQEILSIIRGDTKSNINIENYIESAADNFRKSVEDTYLQSEEFVNLDPNRRPLGNKHEIVRLSKPLFYSQLVLTNKSTSLGSQDPAYFPTNQDGSLSTLGILSLPHHEFVTGVWRHRLNIDFRDKFIHGIMADTAISASFEKYLSREAGLRREIYNDLNNAVAGENKDVVDLIKLITESRTSHPIIRREKLPEGIVKTFPKIWAQLPEYDVTRSADLPGIIPYLNRIFPPSLRNQGTIVPIQFFATTLIPKPLFDQHVNPLSSIIFKDSIFSSLYKGYGAGVGALFGLLFSIRHIKRSSPDKGKGFLNRLKNVLGASFKGILGTAAGGAVGAVAGGALERASSKYLSPKEDLILFDAADVLLDLGVNDARFADPSSGISYFNYSPNKNLQSSRSDVAPANFDPELSLPKPENYLAQTTSQLNPVIDFDELLPNKTASFRLFLPPLSSGLSYFTNDSNFVPAYPLTGSDY